MSVFIGTFTMSFGDFLFNWKYSSTCLGNSSRTSLASSIELFLKFLNSTNWTRSLVVFLPFESTIWQSSSSSWCIIPKSPLPIPTMIKLIGRLQHSIIWSMTFSLSCISPSVKMKRIRYWLLSCWQAFAYSMAFPKRWLNIVGPPNYKVGKAWR